MAGPYVPTVATTECLCSEVQLLASILTALNNGFSAQINNGGFASEATMTRPANVTPYAALAVQSDNGVLTFNNIGPIGGGMVVLDAAELRLDTAAIPAGMMGFRLHLYSLPPAPAPADGAAFDLIVADRTAYRGFIELPAPLDLGSTLWTATEDLGLPIRKQVHVLPGGTLYGLLQTLGAYTPPSALVYVVKLRGFLV